MRPHSAFAKRAPETYCTSNQTSALRDLMCERGCVRVRLSCSLLATLRRFDVFACAAVSPCLVIYWLIYKAGWVRLSGALVHRQSLVEGKHFVCASQPFKFFPCLPRFLAHFFVKCGSPPLGGLPCFGRVGWGICSARVAAVGFLCRFVVVVN